MDYAHPLLRYPRYLARKSGILLLWERLSGKLFSGGYEEQLAKIMFRHIRPGDVVWDVGANLGTYTTRFASAVGHSGKVVAFEPYPPTFERLTKSMGSLKNTQLESAALGDTDGKSDLFISAPEGDDPNDVRHLGNVKNNTRLKSISQVPVDAARELWKMKMA